MKKRLQIHRESSASLIGIYPDSKKWCLCREEEKMQCQHGSSFDTCTSPRQNLSAEDQNTYHLLRHLPFIISTELLRVGNDPRWISNQKYNMCSGIAQTVRCDFFCQFRFGHAISGKFCFDNRFVLYRKICSDCQVSIIQRMFRPQIGIHRTQISIQQVLQIIFIFLIDYEAQ